MSVKKCKDISLYKNILLRDLMCDVISDCALQIALWVKRV